MDPIDGSELDWESRRILAGNKDIVKVMLPLLAKTPVPAKWTQYPLKKSNPQ